MKSFENSVLRIDHPDNWQAYGQGDAVTIAPRGGLVDDGNGNQALAYGVIVNIYEPRFERRDQQRLQARRLRAEFRTCRWKKPPTGWFRNSASPIETCE